MARKADAPDPVAPVRTLLEQLNLTTAARRLGDLLAQAETAQPAYSEFLRQVLEAEDAARWERKLQRRRRWSKLGPPVTLDGFDWAARPQLSPQVAKELLTCRFIDEHRNVILVGRPSTGKTTVAKAIGHAACARALSVYYAPMAEVLQTLHAARADGTYRKVFRRVTTPALLILDDAGFAELGREAANELFRIVSARTRARSTIVVTNLPFKQWGEFLPSPAQAVAIADRLVDDATILRSAASPTASPATSTARRWTTSSPGTDLRDRGRRWRPRQAPTRTAGRRRAPRGAAGQPPKCPLSARGSTSRSLGGPHTSLALTAGEVDPTLPHRP
jgi:DNA replication protein DnaC